MKQKQAMVFRWYAWREAGNRPASREAALRAIADYSGQPVASLGEQVARDVVDEGGAFVSIDDRLSLAYWDVTENGGQLADYAVAKNYLAGLLQQLGNLIYTYPRGLAKLRGGTLDVPMFVNVAGSGVRKLSDMSRSDLERVSEAFIQMAKNTLLRWRGMGAEPEYYRRVLRRIEADVLEECEKAEAISA